jgi:hypothetical protein
MAALPQKSKPRWRWRCPDRTAVFWRRSVIVATTPMTSVNAAPMTSVNATPMTIVGVIIIRFVDLDAVHVFRGGYARPRR